MNLATIVVSGVDARARMYARIPAGIQGATVQFMFEDPRWNSLTKTAVFQSNVTRDNLMLDGNTVKIPPETVEKAGETLRVGICGVDADKNLVIPTLWATVGGVWDSADPSGDPGTDPDLPIWAQLASEVEELKNAGVGKPGEKGDPGEDGGWYTPAVTQPDANTLQFGFSPSKADMPAVEPVSVELPDFGGNVKETVYVNVVQDSNGEYTADKTVSELLEAYNNGRTLMCLAHMDGTVFHIPFLATYEEEGVPTMLFTAELGGFALYVTMLDWLGGSLINLEFIEPEIPVFTPKELTLKIGNYPQIIYNGTEKKSLVIPDVKNPYPLTINGVSYDGSESVDINLEAPDVDSEEVNELIDAKLHSVASYGAKGDGSTDDTQAFQNALAENRVVTVPGGTYILSGALVIRENCCLELSQDTVLKFTQTSGYAIEMRSSATLRGNHAIISVPYEFTGSVIAMDTVNDGEDHNSIPPYTKAGSNMFKRQRFIYDVNIIKPDSVGFCRSMDGKCNGTAIYMSAEGTASFRWMWGITMSGIRIAGGFSYGIRAANFDKPGDYEDNAWNHDMRIEAIIEACEIGVALENCNGAHLAVTIQPYKAQNNGAIYAKHGVYLNDARFIDMIGSRVWDWNASNTLWTSGGQYQHLALIGNCRGLILDDFLVYESSMPIRDLIYTDTPGNFDKMTILQEPGNKWFKSVDGEPYFNNGNSNIRLAAKTDIDEYFVTDRIATFTDVLKTSIDKNGNIYGTASGYYDSKFDVLSPSAYHIHTGFIACKKGDTFYTDGVKIRDEGNVRVTFFDSEFNYITNVSGKNMIAGNYYVDPIVSTERGFQLTVKNINDANINKIAYARFNFYATDVGDNPVMTVNEEIKYTQAGFLADTIKVKGDNVIGGSTGCGISVTGATVGQTVKIASVDETGKPTAWEPTDFPSGGSGGEKWELISEGTIAEEVTNADITEDINGEPFKLSKCYLYFEIKPCANVADNNQYIGVKLNGKITLDNLSRSGDKTRYYQFIGVFVEGAVVCGHSVSHQSYNHTWSFMNHSPGYSNWMNEDSINRVILFCGNGSTGPFVGVGSKYKLYGVRV